MQPRSQMRYTYLKYYLVYRYGYEYKSYSSKYETIYTFIVNTYKGICILGRIDIPEYLNRKSVVLILLKKLVKKCVFINNFFNS